MSMSQFAPRRCRLSRRARPAPFTLMELLVVIGIIALLAGIMLPVLGNAREKAKTTRAKSEISALSMAVKQYEATYGYLPFLNQDSDTSPDNDTRDWVWDADATPSGSGLTDNQYYDQLISILSVSGSDAGLNSRGIRMLEVKNPGEFLDPWGKRYRIAWDLYDASGSASDPKDTPYDGKVGKAYVTGLSVPYPTSLNDRNYVYASYVIWSLGSDKAESATAAQEVNRDNVYSVETVWSAGTGHDIR